MVSGKLVLHITYYWSFYESSQIIRLQKSRTPLLLQCACADRVSRKQHDSVGIRWYTESDRRYSKTLTLAVFSTGLKTVVRITFTMFRPSR